MRIFKKSLWIAIPCILILCLNLLLNHLMIIQPVLRIAFHEISKGQYDTLYVGASHGAAGIDPTVVDNITNGKSFNFCYGGEYLDDSYFIAKEAAKCNPLKRIVYVLDPGYWVASPSQDATYAGFYHQMPFGFNKAEYGFYKMAKADFRTLLFPWYLHRQNLSREKISENLKMKKSHDYKNYLASVYESSGQVYHQNGFMGIHRVENPNHTNLNLVLWSNDDIRSREYSYLVKLKKFCDKKNIELVVVTTPIPKETLEKHREEFDLAYKYFSHILSDLKVPYCDFNYTDLKSQGFDSSLANFNDYDGHMFSDTAQNFSRLLANYLNSLS
ncbi:MAG TPA: hypothetical protein VIR32_04835 [Lachnospiraceae bacterium]